MSEILLLPWETERPPIDRRARPRVAPLATKVKLGCASASYDEAGLDLFPIGDNNPPLLVE